MNNKEQLTRLVIEAIHGVPYEEASKIEKDIFFDRQMASGYSFKCEDFPVTLSRILEALNNISMCWFYGHLDGFIIQFDDQVIEICDWNLLKDNKETATLEDQTDETVDKLITLLK